MNSWFAKLRLSIAMDSRQPLPRWLRRRLAASYELRSSQAGLADVDRALKLTVSRPEAPAGLSRDIMRSIRTAERAAPAQATPPIWRWLPAPAFALAVVLAVAWLGARPVKTPAPELRAAGAVLDLGQSMARGLPGAVVGPLSQEWASLNRDLDNTTQFLLASLP